MSIDNTCHDIRDKLPEGFQKACSHVTYPVFKKMVDDGDRCYAKNPFHHRALVLCSNMNKNPYDAKTEVHKQNDCMSSTVKPNGEPVCLWMDKDNHVHYYGTLPNYE